MTVRAATQTPPTTRTPAGTAAANVADVKAALQDCAYLDLTQLQDGAKSDDIAALQAALKMDPPPKEAGVLDAATRTALHDFQQNMAKADPRFLVDDKVGQQTWAALRQVKGFVRPGTTLLGKTAAAGAPPPPGAGEVPDPAASAPNAKKQIVAGALVKKLSEQDPNLGKAFSQTDPLTADQKQLVSSWADKLDALPAQLTTPDAVKAFTGVDADPKDFADVAHSLATRMRQVAGTAAAPTGDSETLVAKRAAIPVILTEALKADPATATAINDAIAGKAPLPPDFPKDKLTAASAALATLAGDPARVAALATQTKLQKDDVLDITSGLKDLLDKQAGTAGAPPPTGAPPPPAQAGITDDTKQVLQTVTAAIQADPKRKDDATYTGLLTKLPTLPGFLQLPEEEQQAYLAALGGDDATVSQQAMIVGNRSPDYASLHAFVQQLPPPAQDQPE